jgi:hypothetical protein
MKSSTLITTLLAGAAVCALSVAPALAAHTPNIHVAIAKKSMASVKAIGFAKTNISDRAPHNATTETLTFTGSFTATQFVNNPLLLWAETWYATSGGKCIQPAKQKQKFGKPVLKGAKVKTASVTSTNPCGTGDFVYLGPTYELKTKHGSGAESFTGNLTAKKWKIGTVKYNLDLVEHTDITIQ